MLKNYKSILMMLMVVLNLFSCISTKRLTYLREDTKQIDSIMELRQVKKPYRIQTGDLLSIRVKALDQELVGMFNPIGEDNPSATSEERMFFDGFAVNDHGNIRVPTLGEINVLGYTVEEVRKTLEERLLEEYFREQANLFVTVKLAGIRYTTLGEIGQGSQVVYKERVNIMEAVANAGGINDLGDRENVKIIRQYPYGEEIHSIDLTSIDAVNSPYYYIQPNDLIVVNPLPQKSLGFGTTGMESFRTAVTLLSFLTTTILLFTRL